MLKTLSKGIDRSLSEHVFATYRSLRWGLAILAICLPGALFLVGKGYGIELQPSMSAYYFAGAADMCVAFPVRVVFVGGLCAIAAGLYLYKGFSNLENALLNAAAVLGVIVAIVPERLAASQLQACQALLPVAKAQAGQLPLHYVAAVMMFLCLAIVAWQCADMTLKHLPAKHKHLAAGFRLTYRSIAALMVLAPVLGLGANYLLQARSGVFFMEALGIWIFAAYWLVKSYEMALSQAECRAIRSEIQPEFVPADAGVSPVQQA